MNNRSKQSHVYVHVCNPMIPDAIKCKLWTASSNARLHESRGAVILTRPVIRSGDEITCTHDELIHGGNEMIRSGDELIRSGDELFRSGDE